MLKPARSASASTTRCSARSAARTPSWCAELVRRAGAPSWCAELVRRIASMRRNAMLAGFLVAFDGVTKVPFRCLMPTATLVVPAVPVPAGTPRLPTPRAVPALTPTIAPLGAERLIPVRYVREGEIAVRGPATGRHYRFRCGEAQEIPLADARVLVSEGDFAFSGGR